MNRLTGVVDSGGWSRYFGYDQHGNMWLCGWPGLPPNSSAPAATYCSQNSSSLFTSANQIAGSSYECSREFAFSDRQRPHLRCENRLTSATQSGIGSMYYSYDGAGRRVQEISTYNTEKVFVYDAFGQLLAEYSVGTPAPPCSTCYIATDQLGSTRLVTDQNGNVVARHDYLPFGEEIATGRRGATLGVFDNINQKVHRAGQGFGNGSGLFQCAVFHGSAGTVQQSGSGECGGGFSESAELERVYICL